MSVPVGDTAQRVGRGNDEIVTRLTNVEVRRCTPAHCCVAARLKDTQAIERDRDGGPANVRPRI